MTGPLSGIRVLELTRSLGTSHCTSLLAQMGADVIKIEPPSGDPMRQRWGENSKDGSYAFAASNLNKRSLVIDFEATDDRAALQKLVATADVVVEDLAPTEAAALGLSYSALSRTNSRIVVASLYSDVVAEAASIGDFATQAASGWAESSSSRARIPGMSVPGIGDEAAGISLAIGVVAALYSRNHSGQGQHVRVGAERAQLGFMVSLLHTLYEGRPIGSPPKKCLDGYFTFHIPDMTDQLWSKMVTAMGRPELIQDPRFLTAKDRRKNYPQVEIAVSDMVASKTRRQLWDILALQLGISCAPLWSIAEVLSDEHLEFRQALARLPGDDRSYLAPWIRLSDTPGSVRSPAPRLGQHTDALLEELRNDGVSQGGNAPQIATSADAQA